VIAAAETLSRAAIIRMTPNTYNKPRFIVPLSQGNRVESAREELQVVLRFVFLTKIRKG
jgi:hypothetical protein